MQQKVCKVFRAAVSCAFLLGAFLILFAIVKTPVAHATVGINQQINFQGRLYNAAGAVVPDGNYNIQFKIYQDGDGLTAGNTTGTPVGSLKWTESYLNTSTQGVSVVNGFMSVQLGSITPFGTSIDWNQNTLWLSMNIGSTNATCTPFTSCTPDGEMVPMKRLSATPYALNAGQLGGLSAAGFIQNTTTLQTANVAVQSSGTTSIAALIQGAASQTADIFQVKANGTTAPLLAVSASGSLSVQPKIDSTGAFSVKSSLGNNVFTVDTTNNRIGIGLGGSTQPAITGNGVQIQGALRLSGLGTTSSDTDTFLTPVGSSVATKINVPLFDPGTFGQIIAFGLPSTANTTSRVLSLFDARTTAHQPTLAVFSPDENNVFGFSWDGSNTLGYVKNSANDIALQGGGINTLLARNVGGVANVGIGNAASSGYALDVTGDVNSSSQYRIGGAVSLTSSALTFASATTATVRSASGQVLALQGGSAVTTNTNGGDVTLKGGAGVGTGSQGLVNLSASAFTTSTNTSCATSCTITQSNVDNFGAVIVNATTSGITITLPAPTNITTSGRILYITTASGGSDFTLVTNSGVNTVSVAMRQNTTATMIWNGTAWTPGGASNATTLQATYANGTNPSTTPEIKLDSTRGTIDIQDADTTIGADIFNIHASNPAGLGTVLFGVGNDGRVTIQGTSNAYSAFRVLNSNGDYLLNINSSNNYILNNSIKTPGNAIANPNFETGGSITSGEEGWFGPSQATIVNDSVNANSGNYGLQVTANATNIDVFAGSYQEVKPGDGISFQGYVKNSAGANGTGGVQITWYDKDKNILSTATNYASLPGTVYALKVINTVVPASANYMRVSATVRSTASIGTYYFDDFYMTKSNQSAAYTFRNSQDSTTGFQIQSAGANQTLFTADTSNNVLKVGDSTGTDTATTLFVLDGTTANPTTSLATKNGGLFYRSDTNSIKAVIGGAVVDICTTAVTCTGYSASASSTIQLQGSSPGTAQLGNFNITGTGILSQLQSQDQTLSSTNSSALVIRSGNANGTTSNSGNLTLDVGTATGSLGAISIGHAGVVTTMPGTLTIQGANTLSLGAASSAIGSVQFYTSAGANTVTLKAPGANPTVSWNLTLPQNPGSAGDCLKDSSGSGALTFSSCTAGSTVNLQNVYDNSTSPATVTLADNKNLVFNAQDTATDPNFIVNLQCTVGCGTNGRFAIQNAGTDVLTVSPNGGGITMAQGVQVGSATTDGTQVNLQLDSSNLSTDVGTCTTTTFQGAMYYNTSMGSIRACINGSWSDLSNPDTLGLLSFGIVPSSGAGSGAYDLASVVTPGASGPCKVSWASTTSVSIQACVAYSGGRRINVSATTLTTNSATGTNTSLTTTNKWGHVCLTGTAGQASFTSTAGLATAIAGQPTFSLIAPILCLADVFGSGTTNGVIASLYDTRTFTSTLKEAVPAATAVELGMLVDAAGTNGAMIPATTGSQKLYGLVVATNGSTSTTTPNTIVVTTGSGWVKSIAGTAGQFVKTSTTAGYGDTITAIPNNSFYYSAGNTRTNYSTACTSAATCSSSLYVNFIVR